MLTELTAENAFVFRIVHADNVSWILSNGLHCRNSTKKDPNFVQIGNADLIDGRHTRRVKGPYGGSLSDYVPFYFTPRSPMFLNIKTGWRGITQRSNDQIAILYGSLRDMRQLNLPFVFTDRHAYLEAAQVFTDLEKLEEIDWEILQRSDFKRDPEKPEKVERYEAEALMHKELPLSGLRGIACCDNATQAKLQAIAEKCSAQIEIVVKPAWYF